MIDVVRSILLVIIISAAASWCEASGYCTTLYHAVREYQAPGHFYLVDYEYDVDRVMYPSNGDTEPHYPARIVVYEIVQGEKRQVGRIINGIFTHRGSEDAPGEMVRQAGVP